MTSDRYGGNFQVHDDKTKIAPSTIFNSPIEEAWKVIPRTYPVPSNCEIPDI